MTSYGQNVTQDPWNCEDCPEPGHKLCGLSTPDVVTVVMDKIRRLRTLTLWGCRHQGTNDHWRCEDSHGHKRTQYTWLCEDYQWSSYMYMSYLTCESFCLLVNFYPWVHLGFSKHTWGCSNDIVMMSITTGRRCARAVGAVPSQFSPFFFLTYFNFWFRSPLPFNKSFFLPPPPPFLLSRQ